MLIGRSPVAHPSALEPPPDLRTPHRERAFLAARRWVGDVQPKGMLRLMASMVGWIGRR